MRISCKMVILALWLLNQALGLALPVLSNAVDQGVSFYTAPERNMPASIGYDSGSQSCVAYDVELSPATMEGLSDSVAIVLITDGYDLVPISITGVAGTPRAPPDEKARFLAAKELPATLNPKHINFMQSSIKNQTGEFTVLGNAEALKAGTLSAADLPAIRVWADDTGKIWTLDHRRLAAFRLGEVREVSVQWASPEVVQQQMWKMTTKSGGTSIRLKVGDGKSIIVE